MLTLTPQDLYSIDGLRKIDELFQEEVKRHCPNLLERLIEARCTGEGDAELIMELAHLLERFITKIFHIEEELKAYQKLHEEFLDLYKCKRNFVQRYAVKKFPDRESPTLNVEETLLSILEVANIPVDENVFASKVNAWMEDKEQYEQQLDVAAQYAAHMVYSGSKSILFQVPQKYEAENLIPVDRACFDNNIDVTIAKSCLIKERTGFNIANPPSANKALNEVHYCILCHKQKRDSCSKGMVDKQGIVKASPLQVLMTGCPLKVKISETNLLKSQGLVLSPLAVIAVDNPMCALTGHRICNDCSRACIYQKQQPVDVPSIESYILDSVLNLPYGFEIYSLFTRWNPLSFTNILPKEPTDKNVLVVGLGPAGIGIAHYLLNEGHNVVAIDGLKIDPLPEHLSGVTEHNKKTSFTLIKDAKTELFEHLDYRLAYGFGGVSEYGITARWSKNYLKIARILLERRANFMMHGGVRLGSTLSAHDAFTIGFHHIALATGAGAPKIPMLKNMLVKGVMTASSFLMALHLGNAAHKDSIANLQIRLPAIVIGGGLTAVDAATELLAYYPVQVEKFLQRYETLLQECATNTSEICWSDEEREIFNEFIEHARQIRCEKELAIAEQRSPNILKLLQKWGGVTIVYRGSFSSSTAYRLNSEELEHAMSEGIYFAENLQLDEIIVDKYNSAAGLQVHGIDNAKKYIAAKSIVVAIGTNENSITLEECKTYNSHSASSIDTQENMPLDENNFYISAEKTISAFGDIHPYYKGSVVKALASAKSGYTSITKALEDFPKCSDSEGFFSDINRLFSSQIVKVISLTDNIVEIVVRSPLAAANFQPGQFYRLQNLGRNNHPNLEMECLAVTGAYVDKENGTVSVVVLDVGGSSRLCKHLQPGQSISLMGPTGSPTHIPHNENVMLIGGGVGNAVLFSIGEAMLTQQCKVLFFAGFKSESSIFGRQQIEYASDVAVWCCETGKFQPQRPDDKFFYGNILAAIEAYYNDPQTKITLNSIDRIIMVGSSGMMAALQRAISGKFKHMFKSNIKIVASINSPMQCMMKEICGQCIQKHVDPLTGEERFVYSCVNQDQCANKVDFDFLQDRLKQNSVLEKCTSIWVSHCLKQAFNTNQSRKGTHD
ncbi:pyridine nucleotide-disulfide oxidoreductase family protein [Anaplasma phagocytophilum str. CRT53-1]|uniref:Pyridine nucleotide-disulfide oxidoreductase family protein n=2 Tax=Anaplasma phagocytophilum TaxID=948 RepID=A0A0F3Q3Z1_ANAPH|nr:FAD-dependent oxidoreductase [Anaplasma phagocytophilum]EOA62091.1 heme/FAD-binding domain-containing protein [Anaplasma phagocytophilum str. CRT38]KJV86164.1 pyridine nucleotide-disulfide oxidoreductase family protein [Anaplasma phagocytophilum str. CRT53-1]